MRRDDRRLPTTTRMWRWRSLRGRGRRGGLRPHPLVTDPAALLPCCPRDALPSALCLATAGPELPWICLGWRFGNGWHSPLLSVWQRLVDSNGVRTQTMARAPLRGRARSRSLRATTCATAGRLTSQSQGWRRSRPSPASWPAEAVRNPQPPPLLAFVLLALAHVRACA